MRKSLIRLYGRSFKVIVIYVTFVTQGAIFPGMTRFARGDNTNRYCHLPGGREVNVGGEKIFMASVRVGQG